MTTELEIKCGIDEEEVRICNHCGAKMKSGYCVEDGQEYYCKDECLHQHITPEEWLELYDDGNGNSYYTEWE